MNQPPAKQQSRTLDIALGLIFVSYACARVLEVAPTPIPRMAIVALDVLSALAFGLLDGARHYRLRGILVFTAICLVVGNITENVGVVTGFPFGRYYFLELMGPKLFHVPVLLGLAYIGMSYVSWSLARLIVSPSDARVTGARVLLLPFVASFIMVAWDLAQDPVWSTVLHGWIWVDGGRWFGVPVSNYLGWYGTVFAIYLLFAIYLRGRPAPEAPANWRPAVFFYALCAAGNVMQTVSHANPGTVRDPAGTAWLVADITRASALVSIFAMGTFAAFAWMRRAAVKGATTG